MFKPDIFHQKIASLPVWLLIKEKIEEAIEIKGKHLQRGTWDFSNAILTNLILNISMAGLHKR